MATSLSSSLRFTYTSCYWYTPPSLPYINRRPLSSFLSSIAITSAISGISVKRMYTCCAISFAGAEWQPQTDRICSWFSSPTQIKPSLSPNVSSIFSKCNDFACVCLESDSRRIFPRGITLLLAGCSSCMCPCFNLNKCTDFTNPGSTLVSKGWLKQKRWIRDMGLSCDLYTDMDKETIVWDLDTSLEIPERFPKYVDEAFRPSLELYPNYHRLYRVVSCPFFLKYFSSDRRHMKTPEGLWKMPPPPYECIHGQGSSTHNLDDYITMSRNDVTNDKDLLNVNDLKLGVVFDDEGFYKLFP